VNTEKKIDSILAYVKGELIANFSNNEALSFIEWMKKLTSDTLKDRKEKQILLQIKVCQDAGEIAKLKLTKKKYLPKNYPCNLAIGDIVHVSFGFGYCSELSGGHYGIVLSELKANMCFVMPLSSVPLKTHSFYFDDLNLPSRSGLEPGKKSYLRFEQMRNISYRRLENISGMGQKNIGKDRLGEVFAEIRKYLNFPIDKT